MLQASRSVTENPLNGRGSPRDAANWVALNDFIFPNVLAATVALKQLHSPIRVRVKQFKDPVSEYPET
jgi:hypothetical protein